jgi:type IV pilus assembly protein PilB
LTRKKRLGEMLVDAALVSEDQLKQCLLDQKRAGLKLGQFLIQSGIVTESQIIDLLSLQLNVAKYYPDMFPLDVDLAKLVPHEMASKYQAVPVSRKARLLTIATTDPMDIEALDTIELLTNHEVEPVICTEKVLNQLLEAMYGKHSGLGVVVDSIGESQYSQEALSDLDSTTEDLRVSSLQGMAEEAPVVRLVSSILSQAVREGASDVHISPEQTATSVRFRIDGKLHEVPAPPKSMLLPVLSRLKILAGMDIAVLRVPQDGRFTVRMESKEINVRASTLPTIHGENLVLRLLDMSAGYYTLDRLGMVEEDRLKIEAAIQKPYGMILSTGPTGSGKSSSLYAILRKLNKPDLNIITLEDPVEYRVEGIRQVQLNRKAGMTFASGLRAILRQDPDVIMVGEIRDAETAQVAVQAAMTGHRVLSTVHTNDAAGAVTRFLDMGIEPFLVASVLLVSIAQRLVRTVCPQCGEPDQPSEKAMEEFGVRSDDYGNPRRGKGCFNCMNTGYKGRTGVFEVLTSDEMIQDMILRRCSAQEIAREARITGKLRTLREDAAQKVAQGITTLEEAGSAVMA